MRVPGGVRLRAAELLGRGLVSVLARTTRLSTEGEESFLSFRRERKPVIFVFWHGQLLPLIHRHRNQGVVVLVSEHADGELVARLVEHFGFGTARGSSTRGGSKGLRALIRAAREGKDLAITPDGPQGPPRVFKPGALLAAQLTGLPLIPLAMSASSAWRLGSWDSFMIPRPTARVTIRYGPPHWIERHATDSLLETRAHELTAVLDRLGSSVGPTSPAREAGRVLGEER